MHVIVNAGMKATANKSKKEVSLSEVFALITWDFSWLGLGLYKQDFFLKKFQMCVLLITQLFFNNAGHGRVILISETFDSWSFFLNRSKFFIVAINKAI